MLPKGTVTILFCCSSVEVLFCASLGAANKHQQDHFNCLWFVSFWVAKTSYPCGLGSTRADTKSRSRTTSISENSTLVESFKAEKRLNNRKWSNKWRCMSWRWEIFYTWPWKTITKKQGGFHSFFSCRFTMEKLIVSQTHQTSMANFSVCSRVRDALLPQSGMSWWQSKTWHLKSFSLL